MKRLMMNLMIAATLTSMIGCVPADDDDNDTSGGSSALQQSDDCSPGETKQDADGCNTCTCSEDGGWACTERACLPDDHNTDPGSNNDDPVSSDCEPGDLKKADDGCNTCTCGDDGLWACTEIACVPDADPAITICAQGADSGDHYALASASIQGDTLSVEVGHSAGCARHDFTLCFDPSYLESNPVQANVVLHHDANGEMCEAYAMKTLTFDLKPMRDNWRQAYQMQTGSILLRLDQTQGLRYDF